ncbi:MAG: hypothetical protein U0547_15360 [Dehalococcoidia bacterium]
MDELKRLSRLERKSLGRLISELVAVALEQRASPSRPALRWHSQPMHALIDLEDRAVLSAVLERYP